MRHCSILVLVFYPQKLWYEDDDDSLLVAGMCRLWHVHTRSVVTRLSSSLVPPRQKQMCASTTTIEATCKRMLPGDTRFAKSTPYAQPRFVYLHSNETTPAIFIVTQQFQVSRIFLNLK
jgi:hypothetical protein